MCDVIIKQPDGTFKYEMSVHTPDFIDKPDHVVITEREKAKNNREILFSLPIEDVKESDGNLIEKTPEEKADSKASAEASNSLGEN